MVNVNNIMGLINTIMGCNGLVMDEHFTTNEITMYGFSVGGSYEKGNLISMELILSNKDLQNNVYRVKELNTYVQNNGKGWVEHGTVTVEQLQQITKQLVKNN